MTTPTPAQQHVNKLRRMRGNCTGFAHLDEERAALDYALAALEAVEGGVRAEFSVLDNDRGWLIDGADNAAQAARLDALAKLHAPVLIIPADAVEVSRG